MSSASALERGVSSSLTTEQLANLSRLRDRKDVVERREQSVPQPEQSLLGFDVKLYYRQFQETLDALQGNRTQALEVLYRSIKNDGYGLIVENILSQKNEQDKFIFDDVTRASVQLTPIKHEYYLMEETPDKFLVCPEHEALKKGVLTTMTPWRRNLDRRSMSIVQQAVIEGNVGDQIEWASPRSEEWEGSLINKYNSEYGYSYVGVIEEDRGMRILVVYDYRLGMRTAAFTHFLGRRGGKLRQEEGAEDLPQLDRVMTTVGVRKAGSEESTWGALIAADKATGGNGKINGLELEEVLNLQNRELHDLLRDTVAAKMASWLVHQIDQGVDVSQVQEQVKQKFITETFEALYSKQPHSKNPAGTGRVYSEALRSKIARDFVGFKGEFCGDWGANNSPTIMNLGASNPGRLGAKAITMEKKRMGTCVKCSKTDVEVGGCNWCSICEIINKKN